MDKQTSEQPFKSGFVAVMGRPNVGKSTLINALLGFKIAAISPWPQTTRKRQMGILTLDNAQIIFIDTPGIHRPLQKLGQRMNEDAEDVFKECDIGLLVVDGSSMPSDEDVILANIIKKEKHPKSLMVVLNKIDLVDKVDQERNESAYNSLLPALSTISVSAIRSDNLDTLIQKLIDILPQGEPFFPDDQLTDLYEKDFAADLIREAALLNLHAEVPHSLAIRIDEYKERENQMLYIGATIFVERESQKGIVIGQGGATLKKIGIAARKEIETQLERQVFLQLKVKVRKNWRNDEDALRLFGYNKS
ncbi:MAG: GTPase Era [Anaerolineaceae bacterium]|nr:GTPase Era [Anaerolineaceae bacterium]